MASKPTGIIDLEIVGDEKGIQRMLEIVDSSLSPVGLAAFLYGSVGPWVQQRAQERFRNEGDDVSGKWAPLQPATVEIREAMGVGGDHPINVRTHELENYITQGSVAVTTGIGVGVLKFPGSEPNSKGLREKMRTAQRGRSSPQTVPRPVLGLNEKDLSAILTMLAFHIQHEGTRLGHVVA